MKSWHELCVVVPVVLTLALLAVAAGGGTLESAAAIRCRANLKEIYRMAASYSGDNDGFIVRHLDRGVRPVAFWPERLRKYADNFRNFSCPANAAHGAKAFVEDDLLPARFALNKVSFGLNGHISGLDRRNNGIEKITNVKNPKYLVYFGDSNTMLLRAISRFWPVDWAPVHNGEMQTAMADGAITSFRRTELGTFGKVSGWKRDAARWKNWKKLNRQQGE